MSLAITPQTAAGRWSLLFAAITVLATATAWITLLPMMDYPFHSGVWNSLGQACLAPAAAATALGLVSVIHHKERSVLTWATTLAALAATVAAAAIMLSTFAEKQ